MPVAKNTYTLGFESQQVDYIKTIIIELFFFTSAASSFAIVGGRKSPAFACKIKVKKDLLKVQLHFM